jgi:hypothetical protein
MAFRKLNMTMAESAIVDFEDTIMVLGKNNSDVLADIGFLGRLAGNRYVGLVRDGETDTFILIDNYTLSSINANAVDADNVLTKGQLAVDGLTVDTTFVLPKGTASARPQSPTEGQMWFNTETKQFEGFDGTGWIVLIPSTLGYVP